MLEKTPVCAVGVCYDLDPVSFASRLRKIARRHGATLDLVVVANNPRHAMAMAPSWFDLVPGSNELLDFSGYFEGLQRHQSRASIIQCRSVLFVNDSLFTKHAAEQILGRVLRLEPLVQQILPPAICGKLDCYRSFAMNNPWSGLPGYITSFCFALNKEALQSLERLPALAELDGVDSTLMPDSSDWGRGLPTVIREYLRAHLSYPSSPYRWPRAANASTQLLSRKAACAYFEHRMSGVIGSSGVLLPINAGPRAEACIAFSEALARVTRRLGR
ncbi:hypothetical protein RGE_41380 [Rubrivivax gelatinosus IL144]|uniref:Rhamnan synthesis protein F n=1 Tax=Rubrivivax gelatinosus (strain NBRC 100245 / IL144) TaxID=983917 RepID=I0HWT7_RUBGI|nr:hypothetical protein RGE_41380 [Rubrivivax gelatinosus IL144]